MLDQAKRELEKWRTIVEFLESFPRAVKLAQKRKDIIQSVNKPHWTQTEAGKKKLSKSMKNMWKAKKNV